MRENERPAQRFPVALLVVLLFAACAKPVAPATASVDDVPPAASSAKETAPPAPVRTDRSAYVLTNGPMGLEATIVTTLRAPADRTLHLVNCNGATGASLQRKVGEEWVFAWAAAMNACLSPAIVLPPGGEHTAQIYLHEHSGGVSYPPGARMLESGIYRVVWTGVLLSFDPDARGFGPELPLEQRASAPVTIEVPSGAAPQPAGTTP